MPAYHVASRLALFPDGACIEQGRLTFAGCDLAALAGQHGTPLYLYDQATLDAAVAAYRGALACCYPGAAGLTYAGKAFLCLAMAQWVGARGLWLDCTGAGELGIAAAAGLDRARILVHGVNKSDDDLAAALAGAGTLVVDHLARMAVMIAGRAVMSASGRPGANSRKRWTRSRPFSPGSQRSSRARSTAWR